MKAFHNDHFFKHAKHVWSKLSSSIDMYRPFFSTCMMQWLFKAHFLSSHLEVKNYSPSSRISSLIVCRIRSLLPHILTHVSSIYGLHFDLPSQRLLVPPFQYLMVKCDYFPLGGGETFIVLVSYVQSNTILHLFQT